MELDSETIAALDQISGLSGTSEEKYATFVGVCDWLANQQFTPLQLFPYKMKVAWVKCSREFVFVYYDAGFWHVLLKRRPPNDPDYPGEPYHAVGKVIVTGLDLATQSRGVLKADELGAQVNLEPELAGIVEVLDETRGAGTNLAAHWIGQVYVVRLEERPLDFNGESFRLDELPENTIPSHRFGMLQVAQWHLEGKTPRTYLLEGETLIVQSY